MEGAYTGRYEDRACTTISEQSAGPFELKEGVGKGKTFKGKGASVTLEAVALGAMTCAASSQEGRFATPKEALGVHIELSSCQLQGNRCQSAGASAGEVMLQTLHGELGYADNSIGLALSPETGSVIAEFQCAATAIRLEGAVIAQLEPTGVVSKEFTFRFEQSSGQQAIQSLEGGPRQTLTLEASFGSEAASPPLEAGLAAVLINKGEPLEAKGLSGGRETCGEDPAISLYPNPASVVAPASASFEAEATTPPHCTAPSAQWYRVPPGGNEEAIPGATARIYTTGPTTIAESGTRYVVCFTNAHSSTCANPNKEVGVPLTVTETPSPCDTESAEEPKLGKDGEVVLPAGASNQSEEEVNEQRGPISATFPNEETSLDTWYPNAPCEWSIGGTVPPEAQPGGSEEQAAESSLKSLGVTTSAKALQKKLGKIGEKIAASVTEVPAGTVLGSICPEEESNKERQVCTVNYTGSAPALEGSKPFGGRDIIFVHGFEQEPFEEEVSHAVPSWPAESEEFFETPNKPDYWKRLANAYWESDIQRYLYGEYPGSSSGGVRQAYATNRYMTVAWPTTQRLFIGAHAMLTQIYDAMRYGTGVVNDTEHPGTSGFCERGCVIVSHSTGGPLTDIAMDLAKKTETPGPLQRQYGDLAVIPEHIRAHIALHGAFSGSGEATAAVGLADTLLPPAIATCALTLEVLNAVLVTAGGHRLTNCSGLTRLFATIQNSSLVDLIPQVMQGLWGSWINETPIATVTTAGGSPTADGINDGSVASQLMRPIIKILLLPGLDDGVVNMNSQCANPDSTALWPSGYEPRWSFLNAKVFDMGVGLRRAIWFYISQIIDTRIHGGAFRVAAGCTPFVAPDGMVQPWSSEPLLGSALDRYANHYSFLQSVSDHVTGPLNTQPHTNCYLSTVVPSGEFLGHLCLSPDPKRENNTEEVRVITNPHVYEPPVPCPSSGSECGSYQPPSGCASKPTDPECFPLVSPAVKGLVEETVRGRKISFRLFRHRFTWWLWKRTYNLLRNSGEWQENEYVFNYLLR